jgi:UDP-N-acetylmuramate dehydrogenase
MIIQEHIDLLPYNTFHFSCTARYFVQIKSEEDIKELINHPVFINTPKKLILWWGSNMLFAEDSYDWLVIQSALFGKTIIHETSTEVHVALWAGESRDEFVRRTVNQWRTGVENLVSIPGTVGAAPVQNIWAYGVEAKDTILLVCWVDLTTGETKDFTHEMCQFWYRDSVFKKLLQEDFFITSVHFQLAKYNEKEYIWNVNYEGVATRTDEILLANKEQTRLWAIATAIAEIRASKLPDLTKIWTAWSFFQNPVIPLQEFERLKICYQDLKWRPVWDAIKLSAGQLIELVWFKWHTQNNVGVYEKHALVLVHHGEGKWAYLLEVVNLIINKIQETFSIQLIPEVNIISHATSLNSKRKNS